ncbi:hypothetical protein ACFQBY_21895 [Promicromonospora citrea]|uniref:Uncharacterized protein n=1 Tax=Promicromonospora citrea TaxID=43677 RepID=A0A8H9GPN9_9MICO|nr:hypothetical protein [Promicromonospora citrea]NNH53285.1 hypothetical protein [Promicromonospora citrea]GGM43672.1 hypothetical protein GCM10010102_43930 [Promicromonospora citrea]
MQQLWLARAPHLLQDVDEDLSNARDVTALRSRHSIMLELARFRSHQDRANSALTADDVGTDPARAGLQRATQLVKARITLRNDRLMEWQSEQPRK